MSFLDRKPFVVTEDQPKLRWGGGFWCKLCGHKFAAGDTARWIFANATPGQGTGNFLVCDKCDGEEADVLKRGKESHELAVKLAKQWGIYGPDWQREEQMQRREEDRQWTRMR